MQERKQPFSFSNGKHRIGKKLGTMLVNVFLTVSSLIVAMPFFWMLTNSLKTKEEIWARIPVMLPAVPQWSNFTDALGDGYLMRYTLNSFFVAVAITVIILLNSAMFAYALTHIRMKGKKFLSLPQIHSEQPQKNNLTFGQRELRPILFAAIKQILHPLFMKPLKRRKITTYC